MRNTVPCASGSERNPMAERQNPEEQKRELFRRQKQLLDIFLGNGAISQAQYDKSLGDLVIKMGIREDEENPKSE